MLSVPTQTLPRLEMSLVPNQTLPYPEMSTVSKQTLPYPEMSPVSNQTLPVLYRLCRLFPITHVHDCVSFCDKVTDIWASVYHSVIHLLILHTGAHHTCRQLVSLSIQVWHGWPPITTFLCATHILSRVQQFISRT